MLWLLEFPGSAAISASYSRETAKAACPCADLEKKRRADKSALKWGVGLLAPRFEARPVVADQESVFLAGYVGDAGDVAGNGAAIRTDRL